MGHTEDYPTLYRGYEEHHSLLSENLGVATATTKTNMIPFLVVGLVVATMIGENPADHRNVNEIYINLNIIRNAKQDKQSPLIAFEQVVMLVDGHYRTARIVYDFF